MSAKVRAQNAQQRAQLRHNLTVATQIPYDTAKLAGPVIGHDFVTEVKVSLAGPGKGIIYKRYNPTRIHQASAPGDPPATDLGRLVNSYELVGVTYDHARQRVAVEVGSDVEYAAYLEVGTRHILPRPHLRPAAGRTAVKIPGILAALARVAAAKAKAQAG